MLFLALIVVIAVTVFFGYVQIQTYQAEENYLSEIEANGDLMIKEGNRVFRITPVVINSSNPAIIFYPGGLVSPQAYFYKMGHVAECLQAPVYIIKAPFNAAIFDVNAANRVIDNYNLETVWVGGHSLGGISAARFTAENMDRIEGLFLFGSYSDRDLSGFGGQVISIMGDQDFIINRNNYINAKQNLPPRANIIEVNRLNHSGFGNYGLQRGDGLNSLSESAIIELVCGFFKPYFVAVP